MEFLTIAVQQLNSITFSESCSSEWESNAYLHFQVFAGIKSFSKGDSVDGDGLAHANANAGMRRTNSMYRHRQPSYRALVCTKPKRRSWNFSTKRGNSFADFPCGKVLIQ